VAATRVLEGEIVAGRLDASSGDLVESRRFAEGWRLSAIRISLLVVVLGAWQALAGNPKVEFAVVDKFWTSRPSDIAQRLGEWMTRGTLWLHLLVTLEEMAIGLVIGSVFGVAVGFLLGRSLTLARVLDPFIMAIYSIPKLALAPLFILWFGVGLEPKIVLVSTACFFLLYLNTYSGVRDVDHELIDIIRLMGASQRDLLFKVVLPSASPWILTGLKAAVPYSLIGAVVGEIMASNRGVGYLLIYAQGQYDTAGVFAAIIVLMVMGLLLNEVVNRSESYLMRWKAAGR
jgi:NitT/TauT family transport system permease protein